MKDTGRLYYGIEYEIDGDSVTISDRVPYAEYQEAMRPFMFIDSDTENQIAEILAQHFAE
jgi:hypothetical protein